MLHASLSSVEQVSLRPPWQRSTRNVQRGTTVQLGVADSPVGVRYFDGEGTAAGRSASDGARRGVNSRSLSR
jgi:hypothetical protein